jgi:hypothetical protein
VHEIASTNGAAISLMRMQYAIRLQVCRSVRQQ